MAEVKQGEGAQGSINFAGEVFPRMRNWTAGNRATSVGNQLHCNYRKFLLAYECAHAPRDLGMAQPLVRQVHAPFPTVGSISMHTSEKARLAALQPLRFPAGMELTIAKASAWPRCAS